MKILMKSKKGFLLAEESLKIIIAVICLLFLSGFLLKIYSDSQDKKDLEFAKASIMKINEDINKGLPDSEGIQNPQSGIGIFWILSIWPYGDEKIIPKSCSNVGWSRCICICGVRFFTGFTRQGLSDRCDVSGACLELKKDLAVSGSSGIVNDIIEMKNMPLDLQINYDSKKITRK